MTLKNKDGMIDEQTEPRPADRIDDSASPTPEPQRQVRSDARKIFDARWKRNEPAYRFLAEH
jgi:hypothetical protein